MTDKQADPKARRARRIAGYGTLGLGGLLIVVLAPSGGRASLAGLLVAAALSCAAGAFYASGSALADMSRGDDVPPDRAVVAGVLFFIAVLLPAMIVGLRA